MDNRFTITGSTIFVSPFVLTGVEIGSTSEKKER